MSAPFITLLAIAGLAVGYVLLPIVADTYSRYRRRRALRCPETGLVADVQVDARHAAATAIPGPPELRVQDCSLWPDRRGCEQSCLAPPA
jgi:hypothetical protein